MSIQAVLLLKLKDNPFKISNLRQSLEEGERLSFTIGTCLAPGHKERQI